MKEEFQQRLYCATPLVLAKRPYLECDDGWLLLLRQLFYVLEGCIRTFPLEQQKDFYAVQVKEKFGGLRCYLSQQDDFMTGAIVLAEHQSYQICEICGKFTFDGTTKIGGWIRTLCQEDAKKELQALKEKKNV